MGTVRAVGGIVHDEQGRLLLVRRANEPARGRWSLPGGRVEAGETDATAVARELREETGLSVRPGALLGTLFRGPYEIFDYACVVQGGQLLAGDDADEVRWVDAEAFEELARAGVLTDGLPELLRAWNALPKA
ncbi:ADP-ribose pyrophosphatase [Saccharomonospora marina XMU15]|uniref:ADP-ribose pyrophosphatase n=1 Tax=Saccharomonospora marina XMU15 TaxID=882083 RepID=H5XA94_9PSEU|nr:NUDIX domain-containing protein [Saccharomonospora marina]EHR49259.1 ADP-ribose pyrophosphatase [Saccharomonospora marina XMU15]